MTLQQPAHGFTPLPLNAQEDVLTAAFSQHGTRLLTGSADHRLRVYDVNEKTGAWDLVEAWRGHSALILSVSISPSSSLPLLASSSSDLTLKIWTESPTHAPLSGRRFKLLFSQAPALPSPYTSLSFFAPPPPSSDLFLASTTRDGLLTLFEPVDPSRGDDWLEGDRIWILGERAGSGTSSGSGVGYMAPGLHSIPGGGNPGTPFASPAEQQQQQQQQQRERAGDRGVGAQGLFAGNDPPVFSARFAPSGSLPSWGALAAGLDPGALSLVVSAGWDARVFRVLPREEHAGFSQGAGFSHGGGANGGSHRFPAPAAVLSGARGVVRDVAWADPGGRSRDLIATAAADGFVRIYEVWCPRGAEGGGRERLEDEEKEQREVGGAGRGRLVTSGIGAGLAGAGRKDGEGGLEPGEVLHDWKTVAELRHEGVWRVEWFRNAAMLISTGDNGRALVWALTQDGKWKDFAEVAPDQAPDGTG